MSEDSQVVIKLDASAIKNVLGLGNGSKKTNGGKTILGVLRGLGDGFITFLAGYWLVTAINGTANTQVLNPTMIGLGLFAIVFSIRTASALEDS